MTSDVMPIHTERHTAADLQRLHDRLLAVYVEVYAERLTDPFFHPDRYWERLEGYSSRSGFALVTGTVGDELAGYALGYPLPTGSGWWRGLLSAVDSDLLRETGSRTFALTEIMVRERWRRRGYARILHDTVLADRPEERATLLVNPRNVAAGHAYRSWGWRKLGELKPFADSPTYDAMMRELPLSEG
jgi:ribosomal protein S18 acetylase RimI-like enzyme